MINLVIQDGSKEGSESVERVRQAIRYIRQSPRTTRCTKTLAIGRVRERVEPPRFTVHNLTLQDGNSSTSIVVILTR